LNTLLKRLAPMAGENFCLRWNEFEANLGKVFNDLRTHPDFSDVTLACKGHQVKAHKVVLSSCSPFFREVLKANPHPHPLLFLQNVKQADLLAVLDFMYLGEVQVVQENLASFLLVAEELEVKGLMRNSPEEQQHVKEPLLEEKPTTSIPWQPSTTLPLAGEAPCLIKPVPESQLKTAIPIINTQSEPSEVRIPNAHDSVSSDDLVAEDVVDVEYNTENGIDHDDGSIVASPEVAADVYEGSRFQGGLLMPGPSIAEARRGNEANKENIASCIRKLHDNAFQCLMCSKISTKKQGLVNHIENQHFPGSYPCDGFGCWAVFKSRGSLNTHVQRNHK